MFIVLLEFSSQRARAAEFMAAHKRWIDQGIEDGVFLLVGSLRPNRGGIVVAANTSAAELEERVALDPFVVEDIVKAEILDVGPSRVDERLRFLVEPEPS